MTRTMMFALALLVGCNSGLKDERFHTGSSTIVATARYEATAAVNVDEGTVSIVDAERSAVTTVDVGLEPTRIAAVGDELWVTLRGERAIAVLVERGGSWELDDKIVVGAEPYGIVATENGKRVYVAVSLEDRVLELDGRSREELRRFEVPDEPRWLALHPSERALFVASHKNGTLSRIDLEEGAVAQVELPATTRDTHDGEVDLSVRLTGDPAITPDGDLLVVPSLYVDNTTSVDSGDDPSEDPPSADGYGSSGIGVGRLNPSLVTVELDGDGRPDGRTEAILVTAQQLLAGREELRLLRSYPSSVTTARDGKDFVVTMEASEALLIVRRAPFKGDRADIDVMTGAVEFTDVGDTGGGPSGVPMPFTSAEQAGFVERPVVAVGTVAGPRGVAFVGDDKLVVHGFLDRAVAESDYEPLHDSAVEAAEKGGFFFDVVLETGARRTLTESALPPEIDDGRRLFYSAVDGRMAGTGAGVSCSTCHSDGRNDGLTWVLNGRPRQTPSLAGPVGETAPVTWSEEVPSVADEAMLTAALRMGGSGLKADDAAKIEAFVNWTRYPDVADAGRESDKIRLGREIFEREDVGCATCHSGELYTDNGSHVVVGDEPTQTPTLRGISTTAPYLHDGSAPDLRAVLQLGAIGVMGDTSGLSEAEFEALEAFLRTL